MMDSNSKEHDHSVLLDPPIDMRLCTVVEKFGHSWCFELFDEASGTFLLACVLKRQDTTTEMLFTTLQDCHLRSYSDVKRLMSRNNQHFVALMTREWLRGLEYQLSSPNGDTICEIRCKPPQFIKNSAHILHIIYWIFD